MNYFEVFYLCDRKSKCWKIFVVFNLLKFCFERVYFMVCLIVLEGYFNKMESEKNCYVYILFCILKCDI